MIKAKSFNSLREFIKNNFGIVVLGCGGNTDEWTVGLTKELVGSKIITDKIQNAFTDTYTITGNKLGNQGRVDVLFVFDKKLKLNMGKLAIWRLQWAGAISWVDDFIVNYAKDYK